MNYVNVMKNFLTAEVFPYLESLGFKRKKNYFIRDAQGRQDVIEILFQKSNRANHASFGFAIGFIAPKTYEECIGRKQPFIFTKRLLFYVPFGVILCAKENFIAGFDYTYELYDATEHYDELPYEVYKEARPDLSREDFDNLEAYYQKLQQRFHHQTLDGLKEAVQDDIQCILSFFNNLAEDGNIIQTFMSKPPQDRLEELLYFAFEDYANQHGQLDIAIAIRLQLNNRPSKKKNQLI